MVFLDGIWEEHKNRLRGFLIRRVGDAHTAEDLLQDVFLKAQANRESIRSPERITGWLYRIASNVIVDHYRKRRDWRDLPDDLAAPEQPADPVEELAQCLRPMIEALPEPYREVILLSEIDGLPHKELAGRMGLSLSGVKSRVQRGRRTLRARLLDCCDIEVERNSIIGYDQRPNEGRECGCA